MSGITLIDKNLQTLSSEATLLQKLLFVPSISYNLIAVVVFFPLLFLLLISPSCVISLLKIPFINVDFPTPEFPEKALILFFNCSCNFSIPF